jgi:hypothetical protein
LTAPSPPSPRAPPSFSIRCSRNYLITCPFRLRPLSPSSRASLLSRRRTLASATHPPSISTITKPVDSGYKDTFTVRVETFRSASHLSTTSPFDLFHFVSAPQSVPSKDGPTPSLVINTLFLSNLLITTTFINPEALSTTFQFPTRSLFPHLPNTPISSPHINHFLVLSSNTPSIQPLPTNISIHMVHPSSMSHQLHYFTKAILPLPPPHRPSATTFSTCLGIHSHHL